MSLREVDLPAAATLYLCGPLPFRKHIRTEALNAGIPATSRPYAVQAAGAGLTAGGGSHPPK